MKTENANLDFAKSQTTPATKVFGRYSAFLPAEMYMIKNCGIQQALTKKYLGFVD